MSPLSQGDRVVVVLDFGHSCQAGRNGTELTIDRINHDGYITFLEDPDAYCYRSSDHLKLAEKTMPGIGKHVKVTDSGKLYTTYRRWLPAELQSNYEESHYPAADETHRVVHVAEHGSSGDNRVLYAIQNNNGDVFIIGKEGVTEMAKTLEDLQAGDILLNYGDEKKVLFVSDHVVIMSDGCDDTDTNTFEREFMDPDEWKVKDESEEEVKEMTVAEVAEALGHEVKIVKE
jgi:hypothetical protein